MIVADAVGCREREKTQEGAGGGRLIRGGNRGIHFSTGKGATIPFPARVPASSLSIPTARTQIFTITSTHECNEYAMSSRSLF